MTILVKSNHDVLVKESYGPPYLNKGYNNNKNNNKAIFITPKFKKMQCLLLSILHGFRFLL